MNQTQNNAGNNSVIIYSTIRCPYCMYAKQYFQSVGVPYTEKNVELDVRAAREMVEKSGQLGVPVVEINGKIVLGFDPNQYQALLK